MKTRHLKCSSTAAAALALILTTMAASAPAQTVDTRLGKLSFENGFPSEETARKLFDELDYQRAVQAYLWAYPVVSFESIRIAVKGDLGADLNDMIIADNFADPKGVWLTANDTTIYALANVDLGKSGPVVVEIPPGAIVGIIDDFWQRSIADVGLPGPDGAKGGKFLLLPPGYKGDVPKTGYHVLRGTSNNYNAMVRGIVQNGDKDAAVKNVKQVKVYPLSESGNPKPNKFVSMSGKVMDTTPPMGMAFWERLETQLGELPFVPYANLELYYDTRYDAISRYKTELGATFVFSPQADVGLYFGRQTDTKPARTNINALGLVLALHF